MAENAAERTLIDRSNIRIIPRQDEKSEKTLDNNGESTIEIKESKRRWVVLTLFIFYCGMSTFQWVEYSIISNIVARYYNVSSLAVDSTAMSYMFFYVILAIPGAYVGERIGLRWTNIIGSGLVCLGSWIKIFSVYPGGFPITLIGQSSLAISQVVVLTIPGRLGSHWFPLRQISTATSLAIFGNQLGIALGFFLTPLLVGNHSNIDDIGKDLSRLFWIMAILSSISFFLVIIFFKNEPKYPPSETRALQKKTREDNKFTFMEPMKRLMTNPSYLILCNSYGLGIGVLNAVSTILNQIVLIYFKDAQEFAGQLGLILIVMGMFGSVAFGFILDKTQKFKETTVIVYFLTFIGQIGFAVALWFESREATYFAASFLGFFISGYLALGYEMCTEYTYPESEALASGILNIANNVYGIILVVLCGELMKYYGVVAVQICLSSSLLAGFIMTVMTKDEQRRQDARTIKNYVDLPSDDTIKV